MNVALTSFIALFVTFVHVLALGGVVAMTCIPISHSSICTVYANWTAPRSINVSREPDAMNHQRCLSSREPYQVLADHRSPLTCAKGDQAASWFAQADTPVCQTASTMLLMPRSRPRRPPPSRLTSGLPDTDSSEPSALATFLRSCSLWELVSLVSAVAWLLVCLAA
ncbi:hypothetical protein C8Q78DRAFT_202896 [Trametes maxima]|nr:hypothetical protein C8Q78DRAFT_202896 [Trametes maxima]